MGPLSIFQLTPSDQLVGAVVAYVISEAKAPKGAILIFMPGVEEIRQTINTIRAVPAIASQVELLPLHANLTNDEQRRVFQQTTKRKVVVATNVAEMQEWIMREVLQVRRRSY